MERLRVAEELERQVSSQLLKQVNVNHRYSNDSGVVDIDLLRPPPALSEHCGSTQCADHLRSTRLIDPESSIHLDELHATPGCSLVVSGDGQ